MIVNKNFISGQVLNASDLNTIVSGLNSIEYKLPNVSTTDIIEEQKKLQTIIDDVKKKVTNLTQYVHENDVAVIKHSLSLLEDAVSKYRADLDYAKLKIDGHESTFESLKNEFNKKLDDANELLNQNQEKIQETVTKLEDAKDALDEAKKTLDDLAGSGEAGTAIESALARIREFAEWYDENKEYINSYQQIVDMIDGYKEEILQHIDTSNETITGIHNRLDAAEGSIEEVVEKINTQDGIVVTLGSRISANEECITQYGERIDKNDSSVTKVSADLSTLTARYNVTASKVVTNTNNITQALVDIDGINSTIEQHASSIKTNESSISDVSTKLDAVNATITTEVSTAVGDKFTSITETIDGFSAEIDRVSSYIDEEFESVVEQKVNAQLGEIKTQIETANALSGKVTQIETGLLAADAKITSAVTLVETANDEVTSVRFDLEGLTGEFGVLSSKVDANDAKVAEFKVGYDKINSIVTEDGKVSNTAIDVNGIVNSVVNHDDIKTMSSNITQNANNISMIVSSGTQTGDTWTPNVDPATIIASITEDDDKTLKSSIVLSADTIALTGKTVVDNLNAMDITVGGGSTKFNTDGSGYTANGNISWDKEGNSTGVSINKTNNITINIPDSFETVFSNSIICIGDDNGNRPGLIFYKKYVDDGHQYICCSTLDDLESTSYIEYNYADVVTYTYGRLYGYHVDGHYFIKLTNHDGDYIKIFHVNANNNNLVLNTCTFRQSSSQTTPYGDIFFTKINNIYYSCFVDQYQSNIYIKTYRSTDCINWSYCAGTQIESTYEVNKNKIGMLDDDKLIFILKTSSELADICVFSFTENKLYRNSGCLVLIDTSYILVGGNTANNDDYVNPAFIISTRNSKVQEIYLIQKINRNGELNYYPIHDYKDKYSLKSFESETKFNIGEINYNLKWKVNNEYSYVNTIPYLYCRNNTKLHMSNYEYGIKQLGILNDKLYIESTSGDLEKQTFKDVDLIDLVFNNNI